MVVNVNAASRSAWISARRKRLCFSTVRGDRILAALLPSDSLYPVTLHKVGDVLRRESDASTDPDTTQLASRDLFLNSPSTDAEDVGGLVGVEQFERHFRAADMR
jgi:hypothetical protein